MTDEQIKEQIATLKRVTKEASKSKQSAIKFLRDAGIPKNNEPFRIPKKG